ncbi:E3 ubiquitin-protein ligase [Striga asiatica]|uniref:E3 ubiquitin-protein ligase n=1 Tax=Striga asiatica TaxID=4170 RepID=A0A5A7PT64_STRAF|nr:E3 ubiquitin-protein ligase [Striga asiatica]
MVGASFVYTNPNLVVTILLEPSVQVSPVFDGFKTAVIELYAATILSMKEGQPRNKCGAFEAHLLPSSSFSSDNGGVATMESVSPLTALGSSKLKLCVFINLFMICLLCAHSVVEGGSIGPPSASIVTRRRASLNLSQQETVPQDADHAQGASKRKSGAAIRADGRGKRAKIIGPPENIGAKTDDAFPTIHTRTSPAIFVKAVSSLSEDQKRAVHEMGFGCLLDLTITATPAKMGYWLVNNFNHMDRKLQLYDGGKVHVKENDVYSVLGLPRGSIEIANRKKNTESGVLNERANMYGVSVAIKITATKVLEMIQDCERSDDWFKRHFVVLMVTCLFESSQNGVANLRTVHLLDDLSNLFYVDKVVLSYRTVTRSLPVLKSWNNFMLKAREGDEIVAGAFGRGYVDDDVHVDDARHRAKIDIGSPNGNDMNRASKLSVQTFMQEFASKTRVLAMAGIEIIQLVENAPRDLLGDDNFTKMQGAVQKLLGICNEDSKGKGKQHMPDEPSQHATRDDGSPFKAPTQIVDDDFWNDPDNIAAIDAIVDAVARRDHFKRMHYDGPSYNLGLGLSSDEEEDDMDIDHPDCDAVVNEPVVDTGRDRVQGVGGDTIVDVVDSVSGEYIVKRDVVACLASNMPINEAHIDLWARIMNCNEKIGSHGSVLCFFATTHPCNELFFKGKRKKNVSYKNFVEMLDGDMNRTCVYNRKKVSMYVFPVHSGGFSGLICILPDNWKIHILDNACLCKDASIKKSFASLARILRVYLLQQQSLAKYMAQMSMSKSSKSVALSILDFIDLPWTDGVDDVDAGVLTMRHMETFKGRVTEGWNPGVKKADKRQIDLMRKRYCYVIAFAPYNKVKDANLLESKRSARKKGGVV